VAQLAGYVSEHSGYHHGEVALHSTIINMAQNFVGSNNIPLLYPSGQFGTRLSGGKDAANARYIFTKLSPLARKLFHEDDDPILNYLDDDGTPIEPEYYIPIIPMVLVNGAQGIGTGWSTSVPQYNPLDIIQALKKRIKGAPIEEIIPWFRGFKGEIVPLPDGGYNSVGLISRSRNNVIITELPIQKWVSDYKEFLDELAKPPHGKPIIRDYTEYHKDEDIEFKVAISSANLQETEAKNGLIKAFKLESKISLNNMWLFGSDGKLKRYSSPLEIIEDFYQTRINFYAKRKSFLSNKLKHSLKKLKNKTRFYDCIISGKLQIINRPKSELILELEKLKFDKYESSESDNGQGYEYLLDAALINLTKEKIDMLLHQAKQTHLELEALLNRSEVDIWLHDLEVLAKALLAIGSEYKKTTETAQ